MRVISAGFSKSDGKDATVFMLKYAAIFAVRRPYLSLKTSPSPSDRGELRRMGCFAVGRGDFFQKQPSKVDKQRANGRIFLCERVANTRSVF
jgi:hypothetical protein